MTMTIVEAERGITGGVDTHREVPDKVVGEWIGADKLGPFIQLGVLDEPWTTGCGGRSDERDGCRQSCPGDMTRSSASA